MKREDHRRLERAEPRHQTFVQVRIVSAARCHIRDDLPERVLVHLLNMVMPVRHATQHSTVQP